MAAGTSSRFVPLSAETPKGLLEVKGEVLIERQIRQLLEARVSDITVVTGYMADQFGYLKEKFGVDIVFNEDYSRYNNTSSLIRVADRLSNTFICSSDNYFPANVFAVNPSDSFYSALYSGPEVNEYCMKIDDNDNIVNVSIGGSDAWYMIGHVYFSDNFSSKFRSILLDEYNNRAETKTEYWEDVYIRHIADLPKMKIRRYQPGEIEEFDNIDELRSFDSSYINDTRSSVIKELARKLNCEEGDLHSFKKEKGKNGFLTFSFQKDDKRLFYSCKER